MEHLPIPARGLDVQLDTSLLRRLWYAAKEARIKHPMANERILPDRQSHLHDSTSKADGVGEDAEHDRPHIEAQVVLAEAARNEAERLRRSAEQMREVRDQHRETAELARQGQEKLREAAEAARTASEEARRATEDARHAIVDSVHATAESLKATLEHMGAVEETRRTLREIRDRYKVQSD